MLKESNKNHNIVNIDRPLKIKIKKSITCLFSSFYLPQLPPPITLITSFTPITPFTPFTPFTLGVLSNKWQVMHSRTRVISSSSHVSEIKPKVLRVPAAKKLMYGEEKQLHPSNLPALFFSCYTIYGGQKLLTTYQPVGV